MLATKTQIRKYPSQEYGRAKELSTHLFKFKTIQNADLQMAVTQLQMSVFRAVAPRSLVELFRR
jgi:hypothetical protein